MTTIFENITALLREHTLSYIVKEHPPTTTSEESAHARGEPLKIGAKALMVKSDAEFVLAVLPADRRLDTGALKKLLGTKNMRFATPEELKQVTGCDKGAVPPFGNLLGVRMIVDQALFEEEFMAFNPGSLERSIKMKTAEYQRVVQPEIGHFSKDIFL
ncbi:MAG: YbaK/EbsC family protein [Nanoarchaeota archaeon]